jgi:hypothetical protein
MHDLSSQHFWTYRMKLELEGGNDAEVSPSAPQRPKEVRVLGGTCRQDITGCGDNLNGQ